MEYYLWIKAFHIMSIISWMAMLFYLPRLFVYHAEHRSNAGFVEVVKIQEHKLYYFIGVPAFWASVISGGIMIWLNPAMFKSGMWLHIKLTAALLLILYHFSLRYFLKQFAQDTCQKSGKFFRIYNEVPTILMIIIVIMAVVKPI
ncbi:protoporphyrinogen oxidase HemJ [Nitratiruptor tergarcus]|uniref:Protoporphyrinogen IX oxidase n=1 Tax=Nitratiruptor tergarcus DSM 16512 TaxID=1069081 RepID=A0A1W1WRK4_9BACT|nr:protoporphyrinogen oxidase HemJ [Nitratiruptor tergarcus]SMC08886.1 putative membrane protein [Nitratiruptor tergarcus DSM 16512]